MRWRRYRPPMTRVQKARLLCLMAACCIIALTIVFAFHLKTILGDLAVTRVSNSVNRLVTEAVNDAINNGEIQYDDLITFQRMPTAGLRRFRATWHPLTAFRRILPEISCSGCREFLIRSWRSRWGR